MPWGKLDDSLYDHPKLDALGKRRLEGIGLWAVAISWSNRRLTDGHIPTDRIRMLGGTAGLADALVGAGLFDRTDTGYYIHDFPDFNELKVSVLDRRARDARRKRESRMESTTDSGGSHNGTPQGPPAHARSRPVPSIPDPSDRAREIAEQRSAQINQRMQEQRLAWFRETGKWPDDWGEKPVARPS